MVSTRTRREIAVAELTMALGNLTDSQIDIQHHLDCLNTADDVSSEFLHECRVINRFSTHVYDLVKDSL